MTRGQQSAIERLWPRFGIDFREQLLDLDAEFGRHASRVLEIGFGNGETLVEQARAAPELDFLGVEVHEPGVGHCLLAAEAAGVDNLRLIRHDAIAVMTHQLADGALARINLYFPDPWPKKRHHKRRLVTDAFLELAAAKLEAGGLLCLATDWADYAGHIDEVIAHSPAFSVLERREHSGEEPLDRPVTRFERRGLKLDHRIRDWQLARK